ncbi:MAG: class I SAM-dependent DNA methyltransferase [Gemmatimonadaceae bacterium]
MKRYARAYFDRWYRSPRWRVLTPAELARRVGLVVSLAEYVLERRVQSALDVGCGEGAWYGALRALRPRIRYVGIDPSEYAVRRFGRQRNLHRGSFERLGELRGEGPFDLVLCVDVLHYLRRDELERGMRHLAALVGGVAYIPVFTSRDDVEGDRRQLHRRTPHFYRRAFARAGLTPCGVSCYLPPDMARGQPALERLPR